MHDADVFEKGGEESSELKVDCVETHEETCEFAANCANQISWCMGVCGYDEEANH